MSPRLRQRVCKRCETPFQTIHHNCFFCDSCRPLAAKELRQRRQVAIAHDPCENTRLWNLMAVRSYREVARLLGCSHEAVRATERLALRKVRRELEAFKEAA
jgi:DNA-directed RNA polymerase specialized sigma24 family protein